MAGGALWRTTRLPSRTRLFLTATVLACFGGPVFAADLPWVVVAKDHNGFVLEKQDKSFTPWGFNYDHDQNGRLIEDYWETEWNKVERDFRSMKKLGANVVRIHLQLGKFMEGAEKPNTTALEQLRTLVTLAEDVGPYLDLTGLGCYHTEFGKFIERSEKHWAGCIGIYWGQSPDERRGSKKSEDAVTLGWLEFFENWPSKSRNMWSACERRS